MGRTIYITGIGAISAQTEEAIFSERPISYNSNIFQATSPNFKKYIPAMALRRMSRAIKMGLTAGKMALKDARWKCRMLLLQELEKAANKTQKSFWKPCSLKKRNY
ncbi:3-oxoacyl-ACP synthase [Gillisia marina]|uniref:3-oxoacyl-ACP synthase n=1 Tax=Gillisia marina TaxID=1167637 RepID=UPI00029A701C|nr:3-oxoacyl-ACP synthase [Gillisia marina]